MRAPFAVCFVKKMSSPNTPSPVITCTFSPSTSNAESTNATCSFECARVSSASVASRASKPFASQIQFLRLDLIHDDPMSRRLFEVSLLFVQFHRVVVQQPHAARRRRFAALELHRGLHRTLTVRACACFRNGGGVCTRVIGCCVSSLARRPSAPRPDTSASTSATSTRAWSRATARALTAATRARTASTRASTSDAWIGRLRWFLLGGRHRRTTASRARAAVSAVCEL